MKDDEAAFRSTVAGQCWTVRLTIREGRNRHMRRVFELPGLPALSLERTAL